MYLNVFSAFFIAVLNHAIIFLLDPDGKEKKLRRNGGKKCHASLVFATDVGDATDAGVASFICIFSVVPLD